MRRTVAVFAAFIIIFNSVSVFCQTTSSGDEEFFNQFNRERFIDVKLNKNLSTDPASPDYIQSGQQFEGTLGRVITIDGKAWALDGAKVWGRVAESKNFSAKDNNSKLVLYLEFIETRAGNHGSVETKPSTFEVKKLSKKSLISNVIADGLGMCSLGAIFGFGNKYTVLGGLIFGSGMGFGSWLQERSDFKPAPVLMTQGDLLYFVTVKR